MYQTNTTNNGSLLSYRLCETVGIDGEYVHMLEVNWGGAVAEKEQEEVDGFGVVDEVAMPGSNGQ